jgi:diguanylate cyclase (GGDEF)-like protein/PAS domain S-box-containing protein
MDKPLPKDFIARISELEKENETLQRQCEVKIKTSLAKYRRVIDATSEGFLELDLGFRIVDYNAAILNLTGMSGENLMNLPVESLYDKQTVFVHFASKDHLSFEAIFKTQGGDKLTLLFKRSILRDSNGNPNGYLVFFTDLTELKKAQEELDQAEIRYRDIYNNAAQGMYQCTLDGRFLRINPAFAKIFGYEQTTDLLSQTAGVTNLYKVPKKREHLLSALIENQVVINYEAEMKRRDGKPVWAMINARLTSDDHGKSLIDGILIDNTEKRLAEDRLRRSRERFRYLANHDSLTGLFNTRFLYKALDKLVVESTESNLPFSLVFLDMDNFKFVVDTYGHLNGSQALKEVADTLKECLTEPAFGVAYGGDEFVLVLPQTGKDAALEHVQKIRLLMKTRVYLTKQELEVHLSASFGVATFPNDAKDSEGLLALADEAMFHVKSCGKDAVGRAGKGDC